MWFVLCRQVATLGDDLPIHPLRTTANMNHVLVAFGGDEADARPLPLQQAVQGDRRRIANDVDAWQQFINFQPCLFRA